MEISENVIKGASSGGLSVPSLLPLIAFSLRVMASHSATQDVKLRLAIIRGKEIDYVKAIAKTVELELESMAPVPEGNTGKNVAEDWLQDVKKALKEITHLEDESRAPATREEWYTTVKNRFRGLLISTPLKGNLGKIYTDLMAIQQNAKRESDSRRARNAQSQALANANASPAPVFSSLTELPGTGNSGSKFLTNLSSKSRSMLSFPRTSNRSTSRGLPIHSQNDLTVSVPQPNIRQGQHSVPPLPVQNVGTAGYNANPQENTKPYVPQPIMPWDEHNRFIPQGFRLAPASHSNHSSSSVGQGPVSSILGPPVRNSSETTRPNNVINTGSNNTSDFVPGHAHHLVGMRLRNLHPTSLGSQCGFRIPRRTSMHDNASSSSLGSSGSYWSSESQYQAYLQQSGYLQPSGQAGTSANPFGQAPHGGQSGAGSSNHSSSHSHGYVVASFPTAMKLIELNTSH
ncbi:uncharacterized protein EV420DRAFT_1558914 [Desarmillaria tabescens]|uniref:Uncharacterized protein n=1 Tax=Armillaria tabescens TaxID=1929756 RepID=A0AA39K0N2_ARMTA|nr:uncharacterized protein EV420DRAFT_1558914 [Desarmillaria tabescens]KAK0452112.1 hypothetical protein EV420DRAFT_1558914 [Desarmillaria tabescens]